MTGTQDVVLAVKDEHQAHPVATAWRPTLRAVVGAFTSGDYELDTSIPAVSSVDPSTASQIKAYIQDFGVTLDALPDATWATSISQWMDGYWDVLVDLWTVESGRSDLVLVARVYEDGESFRFEIAGVYVP